MPKQEDIKFTQQQASNVQRNTDNSNLFYVDNYGGLNQESSQVNIPYTDSPDMVNMNVTLSGSLRKRPGSLMRKSMTGFPHGTLVVPIVLLNGDTMLVVKLGKDIIFYVCPDESSDAELRTITQKYNVFSSLAEKVRPNYVVTTEPDKRIIMVTGTNYPVEVMLKQRKFTTELVGGSVVIREYGNHTSDWNTDTTWLVHSTEVRQLSLATWDSGTNLTTYSFGTSPTAGNTVTLIQINWHWWAESMKRTAPQILGTGYRFNLYTGSNPDNEEKVVQIPVEIQRGVLEDEAALTTATGWGLLPIDVTTDNDSSLTFLTRNTNPPTTSSQFVFSKGDTAAASTDYVPFGSTWITFGALAASGSAATPLFFHRYHTLWLGNPAGNVLASELKVYGSDEVFWSLNTTGTPTAMTSSSKKYGLYQNTGSACSASTQYCQQIRFTTGSYPAGIDCEYIEISRTPSTNPFIGGSAGSSHWFSSLATTNTDGYFVPVFGIGMYQQANSGVFPKLVALFQDRLILSGFSNDPLLVLCSSTGDTQSNYKYQNFEVLYSDSTLATSPMELRIDTSTDDEVTGLVDWHNSLFVFTKQSVRRVHGGDTVSITPTSVFVSLVGTVGTRSQAALVKTDRNVMFLSSQGLYKVDILEQTSNYYVESVSVKIRRLIKDEDTLAWSTFDASTGIVWLATKTEYDNYLPNQMLAYFTYRDSWGLYTLWNGMFTSCHGCAADGRVFIGVVRRDIDFGYEPNNSSVIFLSEFDLSRFGTDLTDTGITASEVSPAGLGYTVHGWYCRVLISKQPGANLYRTDPCQANGYSRYGFKFLPVEEFYQDVLISTSSGSSTYTGGTHFIKLPDKKTIRTLTVDSGSVPLLAYLKDEHGNDPVVVYRDNVKLNETTDYTLTLVGATFNLKLVSAGSSSSLYTVGMSIPAYHVTPTFMRETPMRQKRSTHYLGYYSNREFSDRYAVDDINTGAGQDVGELAGKFKNSAGVNLAFVYNDTRTGYVSEDIYRSNQLMWDASIFDVGESVFQYHDVVRLVEPIMGVGYSFSVVNFNFSENPFELIGYMVSTKTKGTNSRGWW